MRRISENMDGTKSRKRCHLYFYG